LTPAESDLAAELVRGLDVAAAAERLGITRTTARNQLRSILSKTGAHRQGELLRLLMLAPPQFRLD
jgi:DNA-binding CsgD family transcriptional regulator